MISIVQYGSDTCQPCGALETKLGAWVKEHEGIDYSYVSVELEPAKVAQQSVFMVPAIVVYMDGKELMRLAGYFNLDELLEQVEAVKARIDG